MAVRPAKTQISLGIRPVWSESSLSAWRKLGSLATHWAHSEDSDQTGRILTVAILWFEVCEDRLTNSKISFVSQDVRSNGGPSQSDYEIPLPVWSWSRKIAKLLTNFKFLRLNCKKNSNKENKQLQYTQDYFMHTWLASIDNFKWLTDNYRKLDFVQITYAAILRRTIGILGIKFLAVVLFIKVAHL